MHSHSSRTPRESPAGHSLVRPMDWHVLGQKAASALRAAAALHRSLLRIRARHMGIEFDEPSHTYAVDGRSVPTVTQVLAHKNDWSMINPLILEAKAELGRDVHRAMHLLAIGELNWKTLDPAVLPYVRSGERFIREYRLTVLAAEL